MIRTSIFYPWNGRKVPAVRYDLPNLQVGTKYPVFIFLHGNGQEGNGTERGLDSLINDSNDAPLIAAAEKHGFLVFCPQFVKEFNDWRPEWDGGAYVDGAINYVLENFPCDPTKIHLIGYSGGGNGVLDYITTKQEYTDKLASAIFITSNYIDGDYSLIAKSSLPVIGYHAKNDTSPLKYQATVRNIELVNSYNPNPKAIANILETGGHGICQSVLQGLDYVKLLSYKNDVKPVEDPVFEPNATITHEDGTEERIRITFDQSFNL